MKKITKILGYLSIGICSTTILGYLFNIKTLYTWGGRTPMAIPTAIVLLSLGISVVILSIKNKNQ